MRWWRLISPNSFGLCKVRLRRSFHGSTVPLRRHIPSPEISIMPAFSMSCFRQHGHYPPSMRYSFIACTFAGCFWQSASMCDSRPMSEHRSRQKSGPCTYNNRLGQAEPPLSTRVLPPFLHPPRSAIVTYRDMDMVYLLSRTFRVSISPR